MVPIAPKIVHPGVYVQEVQSGNHPMAGVTTSTTAFIGRALRGPVGAPEWLSRVTDFDRRFGGLNRDCPMSYAVHAFFENGGQQAIIQRVFEGDGAANTATLRPSAGTPTALAGLEFVAPSPGTWANGMTYAVDTEGITPELISRFAHETWTAADLFNLTLTLVDPAKQTTEEEVHAHVSLHPEAGARRLDRVLEHYSLMARQVDVTWPDAVGHDGVAPTAAAYVAALGKLDAFEPGLWNLLVIALDESAEPETSRSVNAAAVSSCAKRGAVYLLDAPTTWEDDPSAVSSDRFEADLGISVEDTNARHAAVYFPRALRPDPLQGGVSRPMGVAGAVAGICARTDASRGVWKAPAGVETGLLGVMGLSVALTDAQNSHLNENGVNCVRSVPAVGPVVWGARTLRGVDRLADDYKYLSVRRLADFIELSIRGGTVWAVFEPNGEPLWATLRLSVDAFMSQLSRQGAFVGSTEGSAYFVKCDAETHTQAHLDAGIVNVVVGYAPLRPDEFLVLHLQHSTAV